MNGHPTKDIRDADPTVQAVLKALAGIRYGSIEIVIHDSAIVQIERKEKFRLHEKL